MLISWTYFTYDIKLSLRPASSFLMRVDFRLKSNAIVFMLNFLWEEFWIYRYLVHSGELKEAAFVDS